MWLEMSVASPGGIMQSYGIWPLCQHACSWVDFELTVRLNRCTRVMSPIERSGRHVLHVLFLVEFAEMSWR